MPKVGKTKYPYTRKGMAAASRARKRSNAKKSKGKRK